MMNHIQGVIGILFVLVSATLLSKNRKAIQWKTVLLGLLLQVVFAVSILGIPSLGMKGILRVVFDLLNLFVVSMVDFSNSGSKFLFGPLAEIKDPWGFIFAFRALPTIIFFSAVMSGLYYLGVLQKVVKAIAWLMQKTLKTSGAETLSGTANIFMGQTEAPLLIKPYIKNMTPSEIYCVMVGGMATIAAGVEGAYVSMLQGRISDIAGHLITASVMGAIGGLTISKIIYPEDKTPETSGTLEVKEEPRIDSNAIEAVSRGASDGISLALNVAAMLIVFISLIAILDSGVSHLGQLLGLSEPISFSILLGKLAQPIAWLLGVPWSESHHVGRLIGEKIVLNEFVAYVHLAEIGSQLADRTMIISSYALCGFANISSIGIQIGGIGILATNQKSTVAKLGILAVVGGNLACFLSACVAGILF